MCSDGIVVINERRKMREKKGKEEGRQETKKDDFSPHYRNVPFQIHSCKSVNPNGKCQKTPWKKAVNSGCRPI